MLTHAAHNVTRMHRWWKHHSCACLCQVVLKVLLQQLVDVTAFSLYSILGSNVAIYAEHKGGCALSTAFGSLTA